MSVLEIKAQPNGKNRRTFSLKQTTGLCALQAGSSASTRGMVFSPLPSDNCIAPRARDPLKPGASPQEKSLASKKRALKARINCVGSLQSPNIAFIEIDAVFAQQTRAGSESRFQRWRVGVHTNPGALPQAASRESAFGAKHRSERRGERWLRPLWPKVRFLK